MIQMQSTGKTQLKAECQLQCRTSMRIHRHYNRRHHCNHHNHHHHHHHYHHQGTTTSSLSRASSWDGKAAIPPPFLLPWSSSPPPSSSSSSSLQSLYFSHCSFEITITTKKGNLNNLPPGSAPDPVLLASVLDLPHTPVVTIIIIIIIGVVSLGIKKRILCRFFPGLASSSTAPTQSTSATEGTGRLG